MPADPERRAQHGMRYVVVTADDFGLEIPVNEAVEEAYRKGVLTATSLMLGEKATADAIRRLRRLPGLAVGVHLALTNATPVLDPTELRYLIGPDRTFRRSVVHQSLAMLLPGAYARARRELGAQLAAFARLGLPLDHVSVHQHLQVHPLVLSAVLALAPRYGIHAIRLPYEPQAVLHAAGITFRRGEAAMAWPWLVLARRTVRRHGLAATDFVFGNAATGHLTEPVLLSLIAHLPYGTSEIYCHPSTEEGPVRRAQAPGYDGQGELRALTSPHVAEAFRASGTRLVRYADLPALSNIRRCP